MLQRSDGSPERLSEMQILWQVWIWRRRVNGETSNEDCHEDDEGDAHQQDRPPKLGHPLSYRQKGFLQQEEQVRFSSAIIWNQKSNKNVTDMSKIN